MAAPTAPVALTGALTLAQIKLAGLRVDAHLQTRLHNFCVASKSSASICKWLASDEPRPLWQLGVVAMAINGGFVMMSEGHDHDTVLMACEADLLGALAAPAAPAEPAAPP